MIWVYNFGFGWPYRPRASTSRLRINPNRNSTRAACVPSATRLTFLHNTRAVSLCHVCVSQLAGQGQRRWKDLLSAGVIRCRSPLRSPGSVANARGENTDPFIPPHTVSRWNMSCQPFVQIWMYLCFSAMNSKCYSSGKRSVFDLYYLFLQQNVFGYKWNLFWCEMLGLYVIFVAIVKAFVYVM